MFTQVYTLEELKQMFLETLLDKTDKVTKVSEGSILNGVAYGAGKIGQKAMGNIAVIEGHLFPDSAYGSYLDTVAQLHGVSARFGAAKSSTYVRVVGDVGTVYTAGTHTFTSSVGIDFELIDDVTIPSFGFTYAKVRSTTSGESTNVESLTVNNVTPIPSGHLYVINEYQADGGRDVEDDDTFRNRIKENVNILARGTLAMLEQVFININPNILRIYNYGTNAGNVRIGILTVNGADLTSDELNELLIKGEKYFTLTELKPDGVSGYGVTLENITFYPVDIVFRIDIDSQYGVDNVRREIQINLNKEIDYRFWEFETKVEWDNILERIKQTLGVKYCPDNYLTLNGNTRDLLIPNQQIPRIRGFMMKDLDGNIITNLAGTLNPIYYTNEFDQAFNAVVLASL